MNDQKGKQGKEGLSRRQFLTYALGGTGAFMAATVVAPLVPFAVDPLTRKSQANYVDTGFKESDVGTDFPKPIEFKVNVKDGWVESESKQNAWLIKDKTGKILAISPICTHLGCQVAGTVDGNNNPKPSEDGQWWFHCPCHGGRYTIYGVNDPTKPPQRPLDVYDVKVENGNVLLGPKRQRTNANG